MFKYGSGNRLCKLLLPIDKRLHEVETSLDLCYILLNVLIIYPEVSSLFINERYPLFIPIFMTSVLLCFPFPVFLNKFVILDIQLYLFQSRIRMSMSLIKEFLHFDFAIDLYAVCYLIYRHQVSSVLMNDISKILVLWTSTLMQFSYSIHFIIFIQRKADCKSFNLVYQLQCKKCNAFYIGEMGQMLSVPHDIIR